MRFGPARDGVPGVIHDFIRFSYSRAAPEGWFDDLDEEQIESIERGRKDHKEGRTPDIRTFWEKHAP